MTDHKISIDESVGTEDSVGTPTDSERKEYEVVSVDGLFKQLNPEDTAGTHIPTGSTVLLDEKSAANFLAAGDIKEKVMTQKIEDSFGMNTATVDNVEIILRDKHGEIKQRRTLHNTVTTAGKAGAADQQVASPALGKPTHMGIGTSTGGTTTLTTELDRNALTSKTRSTNVVTMVGDWAAGDGTGAITEAGIFDASSSGNMWTYSSFSVINKGASDTLSISWTLTFS